MPANPLVVSDSLGITLGLAGFLLLLGLLALLRTFIRRNAADLKPWKRVRLGFFLEREHFRKEDEPED